MLERDFVVGASFTGAGLSLMKKLRPLLSTFLAIWASADRAHNASEPAIRQAISVALLILMAWGKLMSLLDLTPALWFDLAEGKRAANKPIAPGSRHYNHVSIREGTVCKAVFRPAVSLPPASARSGLPPPLPPSFSAKAPISLPAWTLAVRSLVTPAIRATLPC